MRVLGVDLGLKRIGIAVGESEHRVTTARPALAASGTLARDARAIADLAEREGARLVVVGLPLGSEGELGKIAKAGGMLAEKLRALGWSVATVDEAMTSVEAEDHLRRDDLKASARKRMRDGEAARLILERYFDEENEA